MRNLGLEMVFIYGCKQCSTSASKNQLSEGKRSGRRATPQILSADDADDADYPEADQRRTIIYFAAKEITGQVRHALRAGHAALYCHEDTKKNFLDAGCCTENRKLKTENFCRTDAALNCHEVTKTRRSESAAPN